MGYVVRMPQLGMTMEEGVVVEWTYDIGEEFREGDVIAVVESEKTTNDVEAREGGAFLATFVDFDQTVGPGAPIAYVDEPGGSVPDEVLAGTEQTGDGIDPDEAIDSQTDGEATASVTANSTGSESAVKVKETNVSPRARSYAREQDIPENDLASIGGTGPDEAVIEQDVIDAAESDVFVDETDRTTSPGSAAVAVDGREIYEKREGSRLRQTVATRMTAAQEIPQVTLNRRVPVEDLLALKEGLAEDRGLDLSLSDFLVAAVVEAVEAFPEFNAIYEDGVHKLAGTVNVGVAIDVEDGLIAPVIKGAGQRSLTGIAEERSRLVEATYSGEHTHDDLADGTITITNLGHFGVETFDPLINPPQVAILGVGAITEEYDSLTESVVSTVNLSLTFDHRAVDGADAARFLDALSDALLHPLGLLTLGSDNEHADQQHGSFRELDAPVTEERMASVHSEDEMHAMVRSRQFEWDVDEPEEVGGNDTAPNPVEQFLGSLASCLSLMFRTMAARRDIPVESIDVTATASPQDGLIERIDLDVTVVSEADESDLELVLQTTERACYVNQAIDEEIERTVSLAVHPP